MTTLADHANKRNARRFRLPFDRFWTPSRGIVVSYAKPTHSLTAHPPDEPEPMATEHSRWIFQIGRERYAFDFTATATRLPPEQAPVISIEEKRNPRARKIRPSIAA